MVKNIKNVAEARQIDRRWIMKKRDIFLSTIKKNLDAADEKVEITDQEIDDLIERVIGKKHDSFYRIFSEEEKRILSKSAFVYLIKLKHSNSINNFEFENIIFIATQLGVITRKPVDRNLIDNILNFVVFSESAQIDYPDLLEKFILKEKNDYFKDNLN